LYIYSGDVPAFDAAVLQALGPRHTLTVIPVSPQERSSAHYTLEHLRQIGLHARLPGSRFYRDPQRLNTIIMNSDAIYLMGGNTFEYLAYARSIGLFDMLARFEAAGGMLLAESAGSIILSATIATALVPTTCPDEQLIELDDYRGMGRIPFHVSPHFDPAAKVAARELDELQTLASLTQCPVWVLQDGEGLKLEGKSVIDRVGQPRRLDPQMGDHVNKADCGQWLPDWAMSVAVAV
jgi:dipeptidase E